MPTYDILIIYELCWFGFFIEWHINLHELSNAKVILVKEQQWYYLTHSWEDMINTSADVFQLSQVLFVKPSNCNINLNQTLYSFAGNRLNKGFSDTWKYYKYFWFNNMGIIFFTRNHNYSFVLFNNYQCP